MIKHVFDADRLLGPGWRAVSAENSIPTLDLLPLDAIHITDTLTEVERRAEIPVSPVKRLTRLHERNLVPLGAEQLMEMLARPRLFPDQLKERTPSGRPLCALFLGTSLLSPVGVPYVLYAHWWHTRRSNGIEWHYIPSECAIEYVPFTTLSVSS